MSQAIPAELTGNEVRFAWKPAGKHRQHWWWRYDNGWTRCSPEHEHKTPEEAAGCHDKEAKSA